MWFCECPCMLLDIHLLVCTWLGVDISNRLVGTSSFPSPSLVATTGWGHDRPHKFPAPRAWLRLWWNGILWVQVMMSQIEPPLLEAGYMLLDAWSKQFGEAKACPVFEQPMLETLHLQVRPVVSSNKAVLIFLWPINLCRVLHSERHWVLPHWDFQGSESPFP